MNPIVVLILYGFAFLSVFMAMVWERFSPLPRAGRGDAQMDRVLLCFIVLFVPCAIFLGLTS